MGGYHPPWSIEVQTWAAIRRLIISLPFDTRLWGLSDPVVDMPNGALNDTAHALHTGSLPRIASPIVGASMLCSAALVRRQLLGVLWLVLVHVVVSSSAAQEDTSPPDPVKGPAYPLVVRIDQKSA